MELHLLLKSIGTASTGKLLMFEQVILNMRKCIIRFNNVLAVAARGLRLVVHCGVDSTVSLCHIC